MLCPHCGADTPAPGSRCTECSRAIPTRPNRPAAVATMTPPPQDDSPTIAPPLGDSPTIGVPAGSDSRPFDPYGGDTVAFTGGDSPTIGGTPSLSETGARRAGPLAVNMPFGSRYRILRQLGEGGMGVVYQA